MSEHLQNTTPVPRFIDNGDGTYSLNRAREGVKELMGDLVIRVPYDHRIVLEVAAPLDDLIDTLHRDSTDEEVEAVGRAIMADNPAITLRSDTLIRFAAILGLSKPVAYKLLRTIEREAEARA